MRLLVDLAAKFSAACVMDRSGQVIYQFDSYGKSAMQFSEELADAAAEFEVTHVIIEDVPHGINSLAQTKPVLRLQGIIMRDLAEVDKLEVTSFLSPSVWQRCADPRFEGVWRGKEEGARVAAERFGYSPPDLLAVHAADIPEKGPVRTKMVRELKKAMTDYTDAYLIGRWSLIVGDEELPNKTQPPYI